MKGRPNADAAARSRGVCTACPMLCDDIVLLPLAVAIKDSTAKGSGPANVSQSSRVENACQHGQAAFDTAQQSALVDAPDAWEHGRPMALEPAIARAAEALAGAKRVLVTGLRAATLEAIAIACDIAESLGAAVDAGLAESSRAAGPTIARVGEVTAAWEELRDRADLVVFWFCDPTATHPRFLERFVAPAQARTFAIGPFAVLPSSASHRHLPMARGVAVEAARLVHANVLGHAPLSHSLSQASTSLHELHDAIAAATCVAIITADAADPVGLEAWSMVHLVRAIAHSKPAFQIPLGDGINACGGNVAGVAAHCTWRYGAAGGISKADRTGSTFLPGEAAAEQLIQRGEIDCVLAVGPLPETLEHAIAAKKEAIAVVRVSDACTSTGIGPPTIQIRCASMMLAVSGTMLREDGRRIPVTHQIDSLSVPSMDTVLTALRDCLHRFADAATPRSPAWSGGGRTASPQPPILSPETMLGMHAPYVVVGGTIHDPANGRDGIVDDIWIQGGRIIAKPIDASRFNRIDATGLVVMPGGVDLHSHIAGPKVNAGRRISPQLSRSRPAAVPTIHSTGALYASLGYTTVFDAAIATGAASAAHMELGDLPILDKGIYLLAADDAAVLSALAARDDRAVERLLSQSIGSGGGWAVKVANPGGPAFWKHGRRGDHHDLDASLPNESLTPRHILSRLALAVQAIGLPHPLHVHTANLGLPGNWRTMLETMRTFDGIPAHLAHVQFHSYTGGQLDPDTFGSGVAPLVEWFNAHDELSLDVGQVLFGSTVAMTGDSAAAEHVAHATGVPWMSHDLSLEGGCGVLPIAYRERSLVHAWQWAIGLEWFLTASDPWRIALSTDHPNGAHFTAYPLLMRLLGDEAFRREAFARIHPTVRKRSPLAGIRREYSLQELCIITRAAPARIAGLPHKGHLGVGADADIAIYRPNADLSQMFAMPARVYKAGVLVSEEGEVRATPRGRTLAVTLDRE